MRALAPDLVFTIGTYANVLAGMAAPGVPVIFSEHMNMSRHVASAGGGGLMRWLMRRSYPKHLMVTAAQGMLDDLRKNFGVTRGRVIANGLDVRRVRAMADQTVEPPTGEPYVIAVGRLSAQKDYATLIRAFAATRQRGVKQDLVIVGDGEERGNLQSLAASLAMDGHVHLVGHRDNPYPLMKRATLLALTSQWEGFAYVPLEAMALGVPCIATRSDGPEAILEGGRWGMLVPPGDDRALAEAIVRMSGDEQRARFSRLAIERAEQLTIERMAREYRDVFVAEIARAKEPPHG